MRPPVLIIGAHRSGTSATAEALRVLGLQIGQRLDSHSEARGMQRLHEEYLHRLGGAWHTPQPLFDWLKNERAMHHCVQYLQHAVRREFRRTFGYRRGLRGLMPILRLTSRGAWGWKEPRTTLFIAAWLNIFPEAKILHVLRHPLDVALSIQRRELQFRKAGDPPNDGLDDLSRCVTLAMIYIEQAEAAARLTAKFARVRFEDLQDDAAGTLRKLSDFCELKTDRVGSAAAGIHREKRDRWRELPREETRRLLAPYPLAARFGYTVD